MTVLNWDGLEFDSILVTGAAGFIGSAFVRQAIQNLPEKTQIIVLDKLTYAGNLVTLENALDTLVPLQRERVQFIEGDISDRTLLEALLKQKRVGALVNFAAESHVDRSISGAEAFIQTNIVGVFNLLQTSLNYWESLSDKAKSQFRFLQVSTDEVFGQLGDTGYFTEKSPYEPSSPYSASKAAADHLVRAWHHTYKLPTVITNCSNNYGPRQFPEKLIPLVIRNALSGKTLPVYGNGKNIRDWIHVEDHSFGIFLALTRGRIGESYCFGGRSEKTNIDVVYEICDILDRHQPRSDKKSYRDQIEFVTDRKGHDWRYAIDDSKAETELGFTRKHRFSDGLKNTIEWYLKNQSWVEEVLKPRAEVRRVK